MGETWLGSTDETGILGKFCWRFQPLRPCGEVGPCQAPWRMGHEAFLPCHVGGQRHTEGPEGPGLCCWGWGLLAGPCFGCPQDRRGDSGCPGWGEERVGQH